MELTCWNFHKYTHNLIFFLQSQVGWFESLQAWVGSENNDEVLLSVPIETCMTMV